MSNEDDTEPDEPEEPTEPEAAPEEPSGERDESEGGEEAAPRYSRAAVWGSAIAGIVVAFLAVAWAAGNAVFYEELFRVAPTVEQRGVGADWLVGNTDPVLDFLIALVHAADVIMGVFILLMVFVHWASFRRLSAQMQPAEGRTRRGEVAATDGGESHD